MKRGSNASVGSRGQTPQPAVSGGNKPVNVPIDLEAFKGCNSVQMLHALQLEKKREYAQLSAIHAVAKSRVHGAGIEALTNAASVSGGTLGAIGKLREALATSSSDMAVASAHQVAEHETSKASMALRLQTVISHQVVAAVHHDILEKRMGSPSSPASPQSPPSSPHHRSSPPLPRAQSPPITERQRELQKQAWKRIGYGQNPNISTVPPSPLRRDRKKQDNDHRDASQSPTTTSPLLRLASPSGKMGESNTSFYQRSSSFSSSVGSPLRGASRGSARFFEGSFAGSSRRSPSNRRSFFRDMPTAEDVQAAYDATKKRLAKEPLRRATGLVQPISSRPQQHLFSLRTSLHQLDQERDVQYATRRTTVAQELDAALHNSVLACRIATEVSHLDTPLQKVYNAALPYFQAPQLSDVDETDEARMRLRAYGCEGILRWAALSFDHLPRGSVTVAVASDAVCQGYVEFPGTGRAGAALFTPVVLGSSGEKMEHDALHTMCLEGMLGLEYIGRIVLEFHGPQLLEREHLCFTESMVRLSIARDWFEECFHSIVRELKQLRTQKKRRATGLGGTATLRQSHDSLKQEASGTHALVNVPISAAVSAFVANSMDVMIATLLEQRGGMRTGNVFRSWLELGRASLDQKHLRNSIVSEFHMVSLAKLAKHRRAEAFAHRLRAQTLRSVWHTFFVACQRRKQNRHVVCIRSMDELQQGNKGRKEVMAATAAKDQATRLVASLTQFARAQLRSQPSSVSANERALPITLTGHSSGGAVALLAACMINANNDSCLSVRRVVTFGAPKVFVEDATAVMQSLNLVHLSVALEKDPAVHQPWTFDASGTGCFVGLERPATADVASPPGSAVSKQAPTSSMAVRSVRPCPWSELAVTPSAAKVHWLVHHALDTYVKAFAGDAYAAIRRVAVPHSPHEGKEGSKTKKAEEVDAAQREDALEFEGQVLHPNPVRGASHGFSPAAMRCLQHIVTRYGVGNQQRMPRDLLLAVLGSTTPMKRFSIHLHAERVPVGHGGRIDQASYIMWLWHETVLEPQFLSSFMLAFHYEFNGKDFFPRQKALITPPPPPKVFPVSALCQTDGELTFTTLGRTAVHSLFRTYSRVFSPSPLEARIGPDVPLMSRFCVEQVMSLGRWAHRCSPIDAVDCVYQWVVQDHQAEFTGKRSKTSVHDRLSSTGKSGRVDDITQPCLLSYAGELTESGFQRFMQLFVRLFGLTPLQNALWALGYSRQWEVIVSQVTNIECDIHWAYGPCKCLAMAAERRVVNTEEESYLRKEISVLAADIAARNRSGGGGAAAHRASNITLSIPAVCDAMSNSTTTSARLSPTTAQQLGVTAAVSPSSNKSPQTNKAIEDSHRASPAAHRLDGSSRQFPQETTAWDLSEIPAPHRTDGALEHTLVEVSQWSAPDFVAPQPNNSEVQQRTQFSAGLYRSEADIGVQWVSTGNGKRLQRESRKMARTFVNELRSRSGTSVGSKPKRRPTSEQRQELSSSLRNPSMNTLGGLSTMYGPMNTLRIINPSQRKVMHLPPLRNVLLEDDSTPSDPTLGAEQSAPAA
ncbi:lipase, putative [Bodo saltans]|uniref:Lipase, putative n=1 Tax=Bodo saltans TaxID=75058 RepID=A0A0S4KJZ8_BODSA|nr:lipase, putative [Bodo saltans]|eukprot:CUI12365.1 lipase, putative [Bodo saltans]